MKTSLSRISQLWITLLLVAPWTWATRPVQADAPQEVERQEAAFQVPTSIEQAATISKFDLKQALGDYGREAVAKILTDWMALIQEQQIRLGEFNAKAGEAGDYAELAQVAADLDSLVSQAEMILIALAERDGSDEGARAIIEGIREAEFEAEAATTVPINETTALELDTEVLKAMLRPLTLEQARQQLSLWLDLLQSKCIEVSNAEVSALHSTQPERIKLNNARAVHVRTERSQLIDRVGVVIEAVAAKGGDVTEARAYISSVVVTPPITGLRAGWSMTLAWMEDPDGGLALALSIAKALFILGASWILAKIMGSIARRAVTRMPKASVLLRAFVTTAVKRMVLFFGVLVALGQLGVDMTPWLAAIGAAGLVVGLALQGTLSNFASGIMIMIYRPFDVGDVVASAGSTGKVEGMTLVTTTIRTFDNQTVNIPNNMVWGEVITNLTANTTRRVDMVFGIGYGDDMRRAKDLLLEVVKDHTRVLSEPAPNVQVHELADSSVNFIVRPWVRTEDYWDVYWDLTLAVKERFDQEGISIPFPQRDLHLIPRAGGGSVQGKDWVQPAVAQAGEAREVGPQDQAASESAASES